MTCMVKQWLEEIDGKVRSTEICLVNKQEWGYIECISTLGGENYPTSADSVRILF